MAPINFHDKHFRSVQNTGNGKVTPATLFHYRQKNKVIWATYEGGDILFGTLSGFINGNGDLEFLYQHQNQSGKFLTGKCVSHPEILADNRIRLHEKWQWTCNDHSTGESVVEEIRTD